MQLVDLPAQDIKRSPGTTCACPQVEQAQIAPLFRD